MGTIIIINYMVSETTMAQVTDWFADNVIINKEDPAQSAKDLDGKIVGLYFSAHWCPPCRAFTPLLATKYQEFKRQSGDKFEIIFISSDRDQVSCDQYYKDMPWTMLSYELRELAQKLGGEFGVSGIPSLHFMKQDADGNWKVVDNDGRKTIMETNSYEELLNMYK